MDEPRQLLALALLPGTTPARVRALRARGLANVFADPAPHADVLGAPAVDELRAGRIWRAVEAEERRAAQQGLAIVPLGASGYPELLARTCDPPPVLFVRGTLAVDEGEAVALVGSRTCTGNGRELARALGRDLAGAGLTVVSGLARGIDTAAHRGALDAGGRTVAVLGCGLDDVYPPENAPLALEIAERGGAVVSEFPLGTRPFPQHFPRRNRVIAGWARATVVVEASQKSGALVTARLALDEGREVMAVPGHPLAATAAGTNQLLKDGAALVRDARDVLAELGIEPAPAASAPATDDPLLGHLGRGPASADELAARCGIATGDLLARLTELELRQQVRRLPGSLYVRI